MNENTFDRFSNINSWNDFITRIKGISDSLTNPFFRGQGNYFRMGGCINSGWRLEPSLYRDKKNNHPVFINCIKNILNDPICSHLLKKAVGRYLYEHNDIDRKTLICIMRHIELPTPLLDWSKNPYVAAYFAFKHPFKNSDKITIFLFDQHAWRCNKKSLTARDLKIIEITELHHSIPRQLAQDSVYTYCGNEMTFSELLGDEHEGEEYFISYCTLSLNDQKEALQHLESMGISENNLFPDRREIQELKKELCKYVALHMEEG